MFHAIYSSQCWPVEYQLSVNILNLTWLCMFNTINEPIILKFMLDSVSFS